MLPGGSQGWRLSTAVCGNGLATHLRYYAGGGVLWEHRGRDRDRDRDRREAQAQASTAAAPAAVRLAAVAIDGYGDVGGSGEVDAAGDVRRPLCTAMSND
jgi:hypothetical protein